MNKTTKRALLSSLVTLILCCTMLIGTTFAWFTDTVSTGNNIIKSGKLDVELWHGSNEVNGNYKIFDYDKWEPGYTQVETLTVKNVGNLAFKFSLIPNIPTKTSADDVNGASLADVIDVWVATDTTASAASFEEILNSTSWRNAGTLASLLADPDGMAWGVILPVDTEGNVLPGEIPAGLENAPFISVGSSSMTVALHMREEAGNEYQNLELGDLYLTLEATQFTYEEDSFNQMYDAMAELDDWIYVYTGQQLDAALELTYPAKIKVMRDLNVTDDASITNDMLLDLNGYTIYDDRSKGEFAWIKSTGALTILDNSKDNNGTIIKANHNENMFWADGKLVIMAGTYKYESYVWGSCTADSICGVAHGNAHAPQKVGNMFVGRKGYRASTNETFCGDVQIYGGCFDHGVQNPEAVVKPGTNKSEIDITIFNCNEDYPDIIKVYGGKYISVNPARGDANDMNDGVRESFFLEGQTAEMIEAGEIPAGYTITHEIPTNGASDMRDYYIVEYNK